MEEIPADIISAVQQILDFTVKDQEQKEIIDCRSYRGLFYKASGVTIGNFFFSHHSAFRPPKIPLSLFSIFFAGRFLALVICFLKNRHFHFRGGYAMVPFLEGEVVQRFGWLDHREFVDSVALGQITPGPVVITATFVGYKVLGILGACLTTVAVFLPFYCITLAIVSYYRRFKSSQTLQGFLRGAAPSVVGILASATLSIGKVSIHSWLGLFIAFATLLVSLRFKISSLWVIGAAGFLGWVFG